jgi:hypothetical protein
MEAADFFSYKISRSGGLFSAKQAVRMIEAAPYARQKGREARSHVLMRRAIGN